MFKQFLLGSVLAAALAGQAIAASAAEFGTIEEAKAMLARAVLEVQSEKTRAIDKFNRNDPQFRDRDLFVFCFNGQDGTFTAHEAMVGRDVRTFRDRAGKRFGEQMYLNAKEDQITTIAYTSPVPGSTEQAPRRAYVTRIGDQVCGVNFYPFNRQDEPTE